MTWPSTSLQAILNIDHPIIQAPMGGAVSPALTAAIANSGGLGMIAGISATPEKLRTAIQQTNSLTQRSFGVNLVFKDDVAPLVDVALEGQVKVFSFFWGDPKPFSETIHQAGGLVMHTVSSVDEAKHSLDSGTDILVAQGWEAGGHVPGSVTSMVLIPAVADVAGQVPVVAAGGIADGRSIVAALALGAAGVWMGTRFLGATETSIHPIYRQKLIEANETDTVYSRLFNKGWECNHRTLRNSTITAWEKAGKPQPGDRPSETDIIAHRPDGLGIERYTSATPHEAFTGQIEALPMWAGQAVHRVKKTQPAAEIFRQLLTESQAALNRLRP